jgi:UDP-glucose 4-epimerase
VLGLVPRYSTREAFADYVAGRRLRGPFTSPMADQAERAALRVAAQVSHGLSRIV